MSSNIPHKIPQSGIPKPSGSATSSNIPSGSHGSTLSRNQASHQTAMIQQPKRPESISDTQKPLPHEMAPATHNWVELEAKYKQDIEALTESTEMATIEKEIAEEKLDNREREIQELKEKLNEAQSKIDSLEKDQQANQTAIAGNNESTVTVYQLQKVEEQNVLLKQALIKLRDMSATDKKALEDLQVQHEELQEKMLDLEEKEHKYLEQIKIFEEQIDVSQSAQEMVEKLTQQKTDLEDKLRIIVEDLDEMEKLRDIDEQLLETARENEILLTSELDKIRVLYSELSNRKRDIEDYLSDQERTVANLKGENRILNEEITRLKDQFKEGESIEQQKHQIENVAYKLNFSESKMAEKEAEVTRYRRNLADMEDQMNSLSLITKEQSARLDEYKLKYELKVNENSELQRALKKKMDEVSELEIRREMAEKKLQTFQKDTEIKLANLNRTLETMKGIEVQHEEDIKRLMEDNELIERERRELKDQLNKSNRSLERSMQTGNQSLSMMTAQDTSLASLGISFQTMPQNQPSPMHHQQGSSLQQQHNQSLNAQHIQASQAHALMSPVNNSNRNISMSSDLDDSILITRIRDLSKAFEKVNRRNYELEMELAIRVLEDRMPSHDSSPVANYYDIDRAKTLQNEVQRLKKEIRASILNQKICSKSRNVFSQTRNEKFCNSKLALKYQVLENEASALMSNSWLARMRPRAPLMQSSPVN